MTRDDIIRVAREFGWAQKDIDSLLYVVETAAAAERQKVAAWMVERSYATGHGDTTEDLLKELEWQVRESEREACAKLCESLAGSMWVTREASLECSDAIRARGQA